MQTPKEVRAYFSKMGKLGGSAKSEAKTKAARENAKKPRKKKVLKPQV
jgi:hypothetical protein